jgi:hypothetical protein
MRKSSIALVAAVVASVGFAFAYGSGDSNATPSNTVVAPSPTEMQTQGDLPAIPADMDTSKLPPNHPMIAPNATNAAMGTADEADPPALVWKAPAAWTSAPNPNPMRLATYKISDESELVVSRAGGDIEANIARWVGQFEGAGTPNETKKTVHDFKVTVVMIEGTYQGGMGPQTGSKKDWALLGAIVETKGESYFFKVIGPATTVKASQKQFDAMIDGITPSK